MKSPPTAFGGHSLAGCALRGERFRGGTDELNRGAVLVEAAWISDRADEAQNLYLHRDDVLAGATNISLEIVNSGRVVRGCGQRGLSGDERDDLIDDLQRADDLYGDADAWGPPVQIGRAHV